MKLRNLAAVLALLTTGTVIGATTQQFASADISSGDRPVLVPIESCRLADTRPAFNVGPRTAPLGPTETYRLDTQQTGTECTGTIPTAATALAINLTALNPTANGFVTVWAEGDRPNGSTLNPQPGQLVFNAATTTLAADDSFLVYNQNGTTDIIVDVIGYYENHDHDDRYNTKAEVAAGLATKANTADVYTRAETDDAIVTSSGAADRYQGFGGTLQSADLSDGATSTRGGGVSFPNTGTPTMTISFALPPNRELGRPILVQVPMGGDEDCGFSMSAIGSAGPYSSNGRRLNSGWTTAGGIVRLGPAPAGSAGNTYDAVEFTLRSGADLGPGASVEMNITRDADDADDTCGFVRATGGYSVQY